MKQPLVSIVVPNYNGLPLLDKCIQSLLRQSYPRYEIVYIDDAGTDGSYEHMVKKYGKDKRFRILKNQENKGYVYTINRAYRESKGELFCTTNIDLVFDEHWVEELVKVIVADKNVGVIGSLNLSVNADYRPTLLTFHHVFITQDKKSDDTVQEIFAAGIFCVDKKRLAKRGIHKIFDERWVAYGEDDYLGYMTIYSGLKNYFSMKSTFTGIDSYTKKTNKRYRRVAEFNGVKNIFLNAAVFYDATTLLKAIPYMFLLFFGSLINNKWHFLTRLKTYYWLIMNIPFILRKRREIKKIKKMSDKEFIRRYLSYKMLDTMRMPPLLKPVGFVVNGLFYVYSKIVFLKTADN